MWPHRSTSALSPPLIRPVHQAFVQLGAPEDAEMLVKHYTVNPLAIRGRRIRLNICTKYKTLK